jgi:hypothetical protein
MKGKGATILRSTAVTGFTHPALQRLTDQQVRFAPLARRLEQADQARRLLEEIEPGKRYPYQFVCLTTWSRWKKSAPG